MLETGVNKNTANKYKNERYSVRRRKLYILDRWIKFLEKIRMNDTP